MAKLIDLSYMISDNMPVHPYDDRVKLYQDRDLKKDGYNNFKLEIGMHAGTHIDSPMHLIDRSTFVSEIGLDRFIGRGVLLDVRGQKTIPYRPGYEERGLEDDIVILYTGHSSKYGTDEYYKDHPVIAEDFMDFLIERKIKMLGMDLPSPDPYPFKIHKGLLSKDILIIENLTNLSSLLDKKSFTILALPLKIRAEASLARVVALVD